MRHSGGTGGRKGSAALLLCLLLCVPLDAYAAPSVDSARIARLENEAKQSEMLRADFSLQARKLAQDAARNRAKRIAMAARIQQGEAQLTLLEHRMAALDPQERAQSALLADQQQELARLLAALQVMTRRPAVLMLARPEAAVDIARTRAALSTVESDIQSRTRHIRTALSENARLRQSLVATRHQRDAMLARMRADRNSLAALEADQRSAAGDFAVRAARAASQSAQLQREAQDLRALMARLAREAHAQEVARQKAEAAARARQLAQVQAAKAKLSQLPPLALPPALALRRPVEGPVLTSFGARNSGGLKARGLSYAVRPGAQIVAPARGRIAFAGHFRSYGRIIILDHGRDYMTLISGLGRVAVVMGETVNAGEPLGEADGGRKAFIWNCGARASRSTPAPIWRPAAIRRQRLLPFRPSGRT